MFRRKMNKKGVTLIELIVVMVIIAIGAVLIAPGIGSWMLHYRLRSAARDIASAMRTAQMKAISTNLEHRVFFNNDNRTFLIQKRISSGSNNWTDEGVAQTLPTGITITNTFAGSEAKFYPNSTSVSGSVTLTNSKGSTRTISLNAYGKINVN